MAKIDSFLDWQTSHHIFVDVNDLVLLENLWLRQNCLVSKIDRGAIDRKIPVTEDLLAHEEIDQAINVAHFLLRVNATNCKTITHAWAGSDTIRHAIDATELRWQVNHVLTVLDNDQRLFVVRDDLSIDVFHVL